ncbi:High-affnity carbon uptake protein Hat/HatR [[Actinomadura] parvosata subsp. kistnae]|uniref:Novel STAND NTPase 1 domain-containing protein n=1 Tax=[Actinomadura] parvosata subsp. kistnae TaxID=1909395 RepID=A0A1U9ZWT0_9ACTN|nr:WD40 repeat domain-containing protein [Nonomuraea sp. ATCC 55076]AQZ62416.1 hypothetical protein BKM31_13930 [Nonomuraea sp. ATCC 55076]SPL88635.1 High-affnity carbon uptake protein Hat/HatR [Actinomadura parvosata subsp. kistnae]
MLDDGLADLLLDDLGADSANADVSIGAAVGGGTALPLLAHALLATWQRRQEGVLTLAGYRATGGIARALAQTAERTLDALPVHSRALARPLLLQLVHLGQDSNTGRSRTLSELLPPPDDPDRDPARAMLDAFTEARLLTLDADRVQIIHEALLRAWPRLRTWIDTDRADLLALQQLGEDADRWQQHGRARGYLYPAERLAAIADLRTRWDRDVPDSPSGVPSGRPRLNDTVRLFLRSGDQAVRHQVRLRRGILFTLSILLVTALTAAALAVITARRADTQQALAISRLAALRSERITDTHPTTSLALAATSWGFARTPEARRALLTALKAPGRASAMSHGQAVWSLGFSPDGKTLASVGAFGTVTLWDARTGKSSGAALTGFSRTVRALAFTPDGRTIATADTRVRLWDVATHQQLAAYPSHDSDVLALAYSPDGRLLADADANGRVRLWDTTAGKLTAELHGHTGDVLAVAFTSDGRTLVSAGQDRTVRLWSVSDHKEIRAQDLRRQRVGQAVSVAFSPDGRTLASAGKDGAVRLWDVATRRQRGLPMTGHAGQVASVAFSPDGRTLVSTGEDKTVRLWDVVTQAPLGSPLSGHLGKVGVAIFSPDGRTIASADADGVIRRWDVSDRTRLPLGRHAKAALWVEFDPDGRTVASAGEDGTVRLWDLRTRRPTAALLDVHAGGAATAVFSPDGRLLASSGMDGTVLLWDVATHTRLGSPLSGHVATVPGLAFSPDGRMLASAGFDGTIRLWDVATHQQRGEPLFHRSGRVVSVAFSPDGRLLASAGEDGDVYLWDVTTRIQAGELLGHNGFILSVAFTPNGRTLASGGEDSTVRLWDIATRTQIGAPLSGHVGEVLSVDFTPDGRTLASSGADMSIRLWDAATRQQIGAPFSGHTGFVSLVSFSPDGRTLASSSEDTTIRHWDSTLFTLTDHELFELACQTAGRSLTPEEWREFELPPPHTATCSLDGKDPGPA